MSHRQPTWPKLRPRHTWPEASSNAPGTGWDACSLQRYPVGPCLIIQMNRERHCKALFFFSMETEAWLGNISNLYD